MPRLLPLGDAAWTVEFGNAIDPALHARVSAFCQALAEVRARGRIPAVSEWIPAFRSVTVCHDPLHPQAPDLPRQLQSLATAGDTASTAARVLRVPVCFEARHAPDLARVAQHCKCRESDIVAKITSTPFRVYMLGFMPGFAYMGGWPEELAIPRLAQPRTAVPARSLALAGTLCAVYPWQSPGGWQLVGRTPVRPFALNASGGPALFAPGDTVYWQAIDEATYAEMETAAAAEDDARLDQAEAAGARQP